jgi:DNA-binding transcriptional LysR family regulator
MDLKQLNQFLAVVEHGSFHKAADVLHITQPALSISVKKLENELNCVLLDRGSGKVVPTAFGRSLFESAQKISREVKRACDEINFIKGIASGSVTIGVAPYAFTHRLGQILGRFNEEHPGLQLSISIETFESSLALLLNESIDFFIAEVARDRHLPPIRHELLYRNPFVVVSGLQHPLAGRSGVTAHELVKYPWLYGTDLVTHVQNWAKTFSDAGLAPPKPSIGGGALDFHQSLLSCSNFLAALPLSFVRERIGDGKFATVDVAGADWFNHMSLVYRVDRTLSPGAKRLFEVLTEQLGGDETRSREQLRAQSPA